MSWLGEVKKKGPGNERKSYVPGEIASTVARTGSRWPLKGGCSAGDQGQRALRLGDWPVGCLC